MNRQDIALPELNGYEVAQQIGQRSSGGNVVLIALSGLKIPDKNDCLKATGFNYHFLKPLEPTSLEKLFNSLSPNSPVSDYLCNLEVDDGRHAL